MVQRSAILLAAVALGVAPALAVPLTWESNELEARAVADSFGSNYGPPPPSHGRPQRRDIQDRAQIFSRDLDEVGLFARKDRGGDGRKGEGKGHRKDGKKHREDGKARRKEKKHEKRSVFARNFDEDVELFAREPNHHHHHHHHNRQGGPPGGPPGGAPDGSPGGLSAAPDASAMGAMGPAGPTRRAVDDYTQLFTRGFDEDVELFAREPHGPHGPHHHQMSSQGGLAAADASAVPAGPTRRAVDDYTQLFTRDFDEDVELLARESHEPHNQMSRSAPPPAAHGMPAGPTRRAVDDSTQLFTRDFDEDVELFARAPHEPHHPHPQMNSQGGLPPADGSGMPTGPIPGAPPGRRDVDEFLFGREIDELD